MLAHVTNRAPSARGFDTMDGRVALVAPGDTLLMDLRVHPVHRGWEETGEVVITPLPDKEAKAMRKRLDLRVEAEARVQSEALAKLSDAKA